MAEFRELVRIDSSSRKEGKFALHLKSRLEELGLSVIIDKAGQVIGGDTGNLIARLEAKGSGPRSFSAHLDTVIPERILNRS